MMNYFLPRGTTSAGGPGTRTWKAKSLESGKLC